MSAFSSNTMKKQGCAGMLSVIRLTPNYSPETWQGPGHFYEEVRGAVEAVLPPGEDITPGHEDTILVLVLALLHPKLPLFIHDLYTDRIPGTLVEYREEILSDVEIFMSEACSNSTAVDDSMTDNKSARQLYQQQERTDGDLEEIKVDLDLKEEPEHWQDPQIDGISEGEPDPILPSEFEMDDDNKHLERQQQQQHIQHPPMQQPLAEVNNHQQPVEGLENEVKEDVDEFKPEELQMKVDPECVLDDKKRKYDEVDPLEPTFPEPKRTRKTEQTLYFEDDGGDDVDFDSYMETEQKKKRIVKQKKKKVKDQKADSHSKLSKVLKCDQCEYECANNAQLVQHVKSKHDGIKYKCELCDFTCTYKPYLKTHIEVKHDGLKYSCDQCDHKVTLLSSLKKHIKVKHEGTRYACDQCDFTGSSSSYLNRHIKIKHEGFRYSCTQCDYTSTKSSALKEHVKVKHEGFKYMCDQCEYTGPTSESLRLHFKVKHEGFRHNCEHCSFTATSKKAVTQHMEAEHPSALMNGDFQCDQCEFNTDSSVSLKCHISAVHKEGTYPCDECEFVADFRKNLAKHKMENHSIGKNDSYLWESVTASNGVFHCNQCKFNTRGKGSMRHHMAAHHGVGAHPCDQCDFVGGYANVLKQHKEKHGMFQCSQCSYVGTLQAEYNKHVKYRHTNPHPCDQCEYSATRADALRSHKAAVHEGIRHHCDLCDFSTVCKSHLTIHRRKKHTNDLKLTASYNAQ